MVSQRDKTADLSALKARRNQCFQNPFSFASACDRRLKPNTKETARTRGCVASANSFACSRRTETGFHWRGGCGSARFYLRAGSADANVHGRAVNYRFQIQAINNR